MKNTQEIVAIIAAIIGALIYAGGAYFKNTTPEKFDLEKLFVTLFISAIAGAIAYVVGTDANELMQLGAATGFTVIAELWGKAIYRKIILPLKQKWDAWIKVDSSSEG